MLHLGLLRIAYCVKSVATLHLSAARESVPRTLGHALKQSVDIGARIAVGIDVGVVIMVDYLKAGAEPLR